MKINANIWNALLTCASKDRMRPQITTLYVDIENQKIVTTDAHRMLVFDVEIEQGEGNKNLLININLSAHKCSGKEDYITIDDDEILNNNCLDEIAIHYHNDKGKRLKTLYPEISDMTYPPYQRVVINPDTERSETLKIGVNPLFLYDIPKALKIKMNVMLEFYETSNKILVNMGIDGLQYFIMAMKP